MREVDKILRDLFLKTTNSFITNMSKTTNILQSNQMTDTLAAAFGNYSGSVTVNLSLENLEAFAQMIVRGVRAELAEASTDQHISDVAEAKLVSTTEACKLLNVQRTTLYRWRQSGYLLPVEFGEDAGGGERGRGMIRYRLSDVLKLAKPSTKL